MPWTNTGLNLKGDQGVPGDPATNLVTSVVGKTGAVTVTKADVGLGNVDNTGDSAKPVSTATQAALNGKADKSTTVAAGTGLSGGGDLSANRTLAVTYGTAAGTACQGNDGRLSDVRTPSDGSVTNAKVAGNAAIALSKLATGYVSGSKNGTVATLTVWTGTQSQFDAIGSKNNDTIYVTT